MRDGLMKDDEKAMVLERMVMKKGIPKRTARIFITDRFPVDAARDN